MLPDPVSIAAHAPTAALVMRVIKSDGYGTERRDDAGLFTIVTNHDKTKSGDRHYLKVSEVKDATDPYTGTTKKQTASVSISVSIPSFGWTAAQQAALVAVLTDYLADAEVTVAGFLNFQS